MTELEETIVAAAVALGDAWNKEAALDERQLQSNVTFRRIISTKQQELRALALAWHALYAQPQPSIEREFLP